MSWAVRSCINAVGWVGNFDLVYCRERQPCKRAAESHQAFDRVLDVVKDVPASGDPVAQGCSRAAVQPKAEKPKPRNLKLKRVIGLL